MVHQEMADLEDSTTMNALTSSKTGTFYFAFGSNLSPTQMRGRLSSFPSSSKPIAIASLPGWKWLICTRGYANIVELPPNQHASDTDATTVWGVLYDLSPTDEETLDAYEGHNDRRNPFPKPNPDASLRARKPHLQGNWDYNKQYLPVSVTKWLVDPMTFGLPAETSKVDVLVYVDELRVEEGEIKREYVGRMNRAIDESVALGVPRAWCESVMRRWVPKGVYPADYYFGTSEGYVEEEVEVGTEAG